MYSQRYTSQRKASELGVNDHVFSQRNSQQLSRHQKKTTDTDEATSISITIKRKGEDGDSMSADSHSRRRVRKSAEHLGLKKSKSVEGKPKVKTRALLLRNLKALNRNGHLHQVFGSN
jgi:hypothetical protein